MVESRTLFEIDTPCSMRGPKGVLVGEIILAGGRRWRVERLDPTRREAICSGLIGSRALRRFRARQIEAVERSDRPAARTGPLPRQRALPM
jgi:hypothetical protein